MKAKLVLLILTVIAASGCNLVADPRPPSDDELIKNFETHEQSFYKLVSMTKQDTKVVRITRDFTWLDDNLDWPRSESELGFSRQRWNEYRRYFHDLRLEDGVNKREDIPEAIFFLAFSKGLATGGSEKGYVYTSRTPSPLVDSLDGISLRLKNMQPVFRKVKGDWYLYYQVSG